MADLSGWLTIKKMVKEILLETGRDEGYEKLCMHHVINGVRELNIFHYDNVKTSKVTANSLGMIDLPSDFIKEVRLSMNHGGLMFPLTRQDDIIRTTTLESGAYTVDSDIGEGVALDDGGDYRYATMGAKNDYYYTIDHRNSVIIIRSIPESTRTFFLQYISDGIDTSDGNSTLIPVKIKKALKYYVMLQDAIMNDTIDKRLVSLYERNYNGAVSELNFIELPSATELEDMIYATYSEIRR